MPNMFDALEFCLREIEEGGSLETALKRFPEYADELRPILETSIKARQMAVPEPTPEVTRRSRARVMQRAAQLREAVTPARRPKPTFSWVQRFSLSFALAALFLLSGGGLLSASAAALPGERLYPVKRGWENVRLLFIFDAEARELLENEFENERLHEVNELLFEGRYEVIEFAGVFMQLNGMTYVSGLQVILPAGTTIPANGDAVLVSGRTDVQGFIEIITLQILPSGSVVPAGNPIEVQLTEEAVPAVVPAQPETPATQQAEFEVKGTLNAISTTTLLINNMTVYLDNSQIDGTLCIGAEVEVNGFYAQDGKFIVQRVESNGKCAGESSSGTSSSTNDNTSNTTTATNTNNNESNENNDNDDDNSGKDDNDNEDDD